MADPIIPTSATGGFLQTTTTTTRTITENVIHDTIAGVTGLGAKYVIPAYQELPPNVIDPSTDWCSFLISQSTTEGLQEEIQEETKQTVITHKKFKVDCVFYGDNAPEKAESLKAGLLIPQNRAALRTAGMNILWASDPINFMMEQTETDLIKRADFSFTASVAEVRTNQTLSLASASGALETVSASGVLETDRFINDVQLKRDFQF